MPQNDRNITLEDVTLAFRNFEGKEDRFNAKGNRNFCVLLDPELAEKLARDGWNVKYLKARDEEDIPQAYLQCTVSYRVKPPKIMMITRGNLTYLDEDMVHMLDWADIEQADVTLNPYEWSMPGDKHGVKAYVKSMAVKILEDYIEDKWRAFVEESRLELTRGSDYIEGEYAEVLELEQ